MTIFNTLLGGFVDGLLYPFRELPAVVGLLVVSFLTAIGMLLVFRATSDQRRIATVKRSIHAGLFEIRLFSDDLRAIMRAQAGILRHNLTYLRLSMVPMLWMIVPLGLLIAQLQFHYGYQGLQPGHTALLKVRLDAAAAEPDGLALTAPPGIRIETAAVWIPSLSEAAWRIAAERTGTYELTVHVGDRAYAKSIRISNAVVRLSPVRLEQGVVNQALYPVETPLPADSPLVSIALTYPAREVSLLGWQVHWLVAFFLLSIVFAFALRNRFGVVL